MVKLGAFSEAAVSSIARVRMHFLQPSNVRNLLFVREIDHFKARAIFTKFFFFRFFDFRLRVYRVDSNGVLSSQLETKR